MNENMQDVLVYSGFGVAIVVIGYYGIIRPLLNECEISLDDIKEKIGHIIDNGKKK